jgi:hypothetical protein
MVESAINLENTKISKVVNLIGLKLSDEELTNLKFGNNISLESRKLSEIGLVFILAEAILRKNLVTVKNITFCHLQETVSEVSQHSGIPIYCWDFETSGKYCLLLALVDGKPAIKISNYSQEPKNS